MTPRHYQSNWLQPKRATLKLPGSDPKKEPRAVSLDNRMPSTKSELPTIKDEELSASLDGRGNLNSSRKSSNASSINKTAFSPHEQVSPQKRDNSSNGYHDNTNYDGSTSKPASKSSSKASSPHVQSSPQPRDTSFKVLGDTKPASRSSSKASSPHEQSSPQPRDTSFKVLGDTKPTSRSSSNASSSHEQILSPNNEEEVSYKINIGTKTNSSSSSHHELLQEERLVMLDYVYKVNYHTRAVIPALDYYPLSIINRSKKWGENIHAAAYIDACTD